MWVVVSIEYISLMLYKMDFHISILESVCLRATMASWKIWRRTTVIKCIVIENDDDNNDEE